MFENIYDILKGTCPNRNELTIKHTKEATKVFGKWLNAKNIEWDGDLHEIKIGKHFIIKLLIQ